MSAPTPWEEVVADEIESATTEIPVQQQLPTPVDSTATVPSVSPTPTSSGGTLTLADLQAVERQVLGKAQQVALDVVEAKLRGQDWAISTQTMSGQAVKVADAKNRAWRTLLQNLGIDLVVALATLVPMLASMNFTDRTAWIVFGTSVLKTVVAVFVTYVSRLSVTPPNPAETVLQQQLTASPPNEKS